jgi:WD40 repeat protein
VAACCCPLTSPPCPPLQSPLAVIGGHSRAVSYVRFLGDGRRLLTASTDSALKLWDIAAEMGRPAGQPAAPQLTYTGGWLQNFGTYPS